MYVPLWVIELAAILFVGPLIMALCLGMLVSLLRVCLAPLIGIMWLIERLRRLCGLEPRFSWDELRKNELEHPEKALERQKKAENERTTRWNKRMEEIAALEERAINESNASREKWTDFAVNDFTWHSESSVEETYARFARIFTASPASGHSTDTMHPSAAHHTLPAK